ncbi:hypothetical protein Q3G72_011956 [Acer saccharum]|nr:hypothetical protein Q3G72_011956 [Acer saccharum]
MPYNQIMIVMEWVDNLHILTNRVDGALEALKLSIHYQCRENDGDIKQHGPKAPPGISESSKGFREMSTGLKALNKSSLKKMKMKMGPSNAQVLEAMKGPNKTDVRILKRPHNEAASVGDSKELEEENCSSTDNQVSHVSATQYLNLVGEETSKVCNQEIGKRRNTAYGRKTLNSIKRHDMITRKDRINEENILGSMGCSDSIRSRGRGRWKLEEEVAKVIEKGLDLGVINGQAASKGSVEVPIDEQNNRKSVEEEIGCREREDEERYKAQQR